MAKRQPVSASLRWAVFARDKFTCLYCGAQAGQDGVVLAADHIISVKDGGDSSMDNLVTACQRCNGGKGARSLVDAPTAERSLEEARARAAHLAELAQSSREAATAMKELEQVAVNIKCEAYGVKSVDMPQAEVTSAVRHIREFGADRLTEWYQSAYRNRVSERNAGRYVNGIAKNVREGRST
jgi:hypothetical protein